METTVLSNEQVLSIINKHGARREKLLAILLDLQDASGLNYISEEVSLIVADKLKMTPAKLYEVLTFYSMLHSKPQAKYLIEVCHSTPCYFNKSKIISDTLERELAVKEGEATEDGLFIFHYVQCFGACDVSPAVKINHEIYGPLDTEEEVIELLNELRNKA